MKQFFLVGMLLLATFFTTSSFAPDRNGLVDPNKTDFYGTVNLISNSRNDYDVYLDGERIYTTGAREQVSLYLKPFPYSIVLIQKNGYLMRPTTLEYKVNVHWKKIINIVFPH